MSIVSFILGLTVTVAVATILLRKHKWSMRHRECTLPPGPRGWPVVGNLLDLPKERPWLAYQDLCEIYGDMVYLRVLNTPMLIVSSADIAFDLLDKRSSIYSDRPVSTILELTGWNFSLGFMPYGQEWRSVRRNIHEHFNKVASQRHRNAQTHEVHSFLRRCLTHTGKQLDPSEVQLFVSAVVMRAVYGLEIQDKHNVYLKTILHSIHTLDEVSQPGKFWVDFVPILRHIPPCVPGAASAKFAAKVRPVVADMVNRPYNAVQNAKEPQDCIALRMMNKVSRIVDPEQRSEADKHARYAAGVAYAAGADTSQSLVQLFLCTMATYPAIQKRAQAELSSVIGTSRLPAFEDLGSLIYVRAILLECMRWMAIAPLGLPHRLIKDDYYRGYFIPAGTVVIPLIWSMARDPRIYANPETFNPDRFVANGAQDPYVRDPESLVFGFGRRVCPGRHFATDTVFLTIASILHVFDVVPSLDENGQQRDTVPEWFGGLVGYPEPLHYMLKSRSEELEGIVQKIGR